MATIDGGTLALLIVLALAIIGLLGLSIYMLRTARRSLPADLEISLQEIPRFWFGINNIIFAVLALLLLLIIVFPAKDIRTILFVLIGLTFLASLILVTRSIIASLRLSTRFREYTRKKREQAAD